MTLISRLNKQVSNGFAVDPADSFTFGARMDFPVITALPANRVYSMAYGTNLIRTINLALESGGGTEVVSKRQCHGVERPEHRTSVCAQAADHADSATICHTQPPPTILPGLCIAVSSRKKIYFIRIKQIPLISFYRCAWLFFGLIGCYSSINVMLCT